MSEAPNQPMSPRQRAKIVASLDKMVKKGRMTEGEAARLRATSETEFDAALRVLRLRHAEKQFDEAIADGHMTQKEADDILARIKRGEHPRSLRSHLHRNTSDG